MSRFAKISILILCLASAMPAMAYNVVQANWTANCVFSTSCSITVTDHASYFAVSGGSGNGRLQSRIAQGQPGSTAAGKYLYLYRLDMSQVAGLTYIPSVDMIAISSVGPILQYDYNFDSTATDHVYFSTSGLGSKGISSSFVFWGWTYFEFTSPIAAGSYPGGGESSYFFGFASNYPPVVRNISVHTDSGWVTVTGYAPQYP